MSRELNAMRKRVKRARRFMVNTCPASRHLHMMAEALAAGRKYHMLDEEPQHCAETMLGVLHSLWTLRTKTGWPDEKESARMLNRANAKIAKRLAKP